ncbi:hypothetical protein [Nonomuraea sp. NPDC005692]|uniref:hypothetical protein n=1 Tax=Nonomuraea sp. NPDC005692 TaxID=3157168 RepID=UPI0034035126
MTRKVPIIAEIRGLVSNRLAAVDTDDPEARLLTGPRGGRISTAVLRDATHWDEVVTQLGYEHLRRHDLRHTGLTWMADGGVPLHVLRKIAGQGSDDYTALPPPRPRRHRRGRECAQRAHGGDVVPKWSPAASCLENHSQDRDTRKGRLIWAYTQVNRPFTTVGTTGFEPATP